MNRDPNGLAAYSRQYPKRLLICVISSVCSSLNVAGATADTSMYRLPRPPSNVGAHEISPDPITNFRQVVGG